MISKRIGAKWSVTAFSIALFSTLGASLGACASSTPSEPPLSMDPIDAGSVDTGADTSRPMVDAGRSDAAAIDATAIDAGTIDPSDPPDEWYVPTNVPLAATPPMGWNSWNFFQANVSEAKVEATADVMVSSGMRDAGYEYLNIDDGWADHRDSAGNIVAGSNFPNGMKTVADYIHSKGLKAGIYSAVADTTCLLRPGSRGHTVQDATAYAAWGMDYAKIDACGTIDANDPSAGWAEWHAALAASSRPIVYSICPAGRYGVTNWAPALGNLWRTTDDINANDWNWIMNIANINEQLASLAAPGAWNDPDMLEVGNGALTFDQKKTHFSLWTIMAAPLIAGNDLTAMTDETKSVLTNAEAIAVDQDPIGYQGYRVRQDGDSDVWMKPLSGSGVRAVALTNHRSTASAEIAFTWEEIGLRKGSATVRDLWAHADQGTFTDGYKATVPAYGTVLLRVVGAPPSLPHGKVTLSTLAATYAANYWGPIEHDTSNGERPGGDGHPIAIAGKAYGTGLGVHAGSLTRYRLGARCTRFTTDVGVDDEVANVGTVVFRVFADGVKLADSGTMKKGDAAKTFDVDITGKKELKLLVANAEDGNDSDHADWAGATLDCSP